MALLESVSTKRETYLHGHHRSVLSAHSARTADDAAAFLLPHLQPGMRLLDVGCGPGTITVGLADAVGESGSVLGIDISDELQKEWDKRLHETGTSNLEFRIDNIYETAIERGQFDVVYAHQILQHLGDPVGALTAAAKLAKPNGFVAVREVDWGTFAAYPESRALDDFRRVYDAVAIRNGGTPTAGRHMLKWMEETGVLTDIHITTSTWTFFEETGKTWWGDQWSQRILATDIAVKAMEYGIATRAELESISRGWQEWKNAPGSVSCFTHFEGLARRA